MFQREYTRTPSGWKAAVILRSQNAINVNELHYSDTADAGLLRKTIRQGKRPDLAAERLGVAGGHPELILKYKHTVFVAFLPDSAAAELLPFPAISRVPDVTMIDGW